MANDTQSTPQTTKSARKPRNDKDESSMYNRYKPDLYPYKWNEKKPTLPWIRPYYTRVFDDADENYICDKSSFSNIESTEYRFMAKNDKKFLNRIHEDTIEAVKKLEQANKINPQNLVQWATEMRIKMYFNSLLGILYDIMSDLRTNRRLSSSRVSRITDVTELCTLTSDEISKIQHDTSVLLHPNKSVATRTYNKMSQAGGKQRRTATVIRTLNNVLRDSKAYSILERPEKITQILRLLQEFQALKKHAQDDKLVISQATKDAILNNDLNIIEQGIRSISSDGSFKGLTNEEIKTFQQKLLKITKRATIDQSFLESIGQDLYNLLEQDYSNAAKQYMKNNLYTSNGIADSLSNLICEVALNKKRGQYEKILNTGVLENRLANGQVGQPFIMTVNSQAYELFTQIYEEIYRISSNQSENKTKIENDQIISVLKQLQHKYSKQTSGNKIYVSNAASGSKKNMQTVGTLSSFVSSISTGNTNFLRYGFYNYAAAKQFMEIRGGKNAGLTQDLSYSYLTYYNRKQRMSWKVPNESPQGYHTESVMKSINSNKRAGEKLEVYAWRRQLQLMKSLFIQHGVDAIIRLSIDNFIREELSGIAYKDYGLPGELIMIIYEYNLLSRINKGYSGNNSTTELQKRLSVLGEALQIFENTRNDSVVDEMESIGLTILDAYCKKINIPQHTYEKCKTKLHDKISKVKNKVNIKTVRNKLQVQGSLDFIIGIEQYTDAHIKNYRNVFDNYAEIERRLSNLHIMAGAVRYSGNR